MSEAFRKRTRTERFWEVLPGIMFWGTMILAILMAKYQPLWTSIFIICFDLYWVLKALNVATHLLASYLVFRIHTTLNWLERLQYMSGNTPEFIKQLAKEAKEDPRRTARNYFAREKIRLEKFSRKIADYEDIYHLVLVNFYNESFEIIASNVDALSKVQYPMDKIFVVLASEERGGESAQEVARQILEKYQNVFGRLVVTVHPDGIVGELKGKSANASWAARAQLPELEKLGIPIENVIVSNFDSDTVVHPQYFARVTYEFLTAEKPYNSSYQPIAVYNNNIWDAPALIRVVSVSNSFWQFTESSRPDRLRTFSSHSIPLKTLVDVGFWKVDLVNEDGFIFWQCYLHYQGDFQVVPLFLPISLDTCLDSTTWQTLKNQYKQKQRWAYNVEYYPHLIWPLIKSKAPFRDKFLKLFQYVEGNFNWATASLLIAVLGLLPLFLGGAEFLDTVVAYNLPRMTQFLLRTSLVFLAASVYVNLILLPPRPQKYTRWRSFMMYAQWLLVPIVSLVFGSIPAIDAQTRLMLGKYLGFWVTPKARKGEVTAHTMKEMRTAGGPESAN